MDEFDRQEAEIKDGLATEAIIMHYTPWLVEGKTILEQLRVLDDLTAFTEGEHETGRFLVEEGIPVDLGSVTFTFNMLEKQVVSYALLLVGFFSRSLGEIAEDVAHRLVIENERVLDTFTDEQNEFFKAATRKLADKQIANMFGLTLEEYQQHKEDALETDRALLAETDAAEVESVDTTDGEIVEQSSWVASDDEETL